ncbi:MAG TPA: response regulator [Cytophagales bacterium]|nr:response regulator [Cytophagales bacterium]
MSKKLRNIILVDDDDITNYLHKELFEDLNIAEKIIVFSDGATAFNLIKEELDNQEYNISKQPPDIIFLDLNMPAMDGFEFLEKLSATPGKENLIIVVLTTSSNRKDIERARKFNVAEYINKPISEKKIEDLLKKVLG